MNNVTDLLPESFLSSMKELLQEEYSSYLSSFEEDYYQGIRVNTTKITTEEFVRLFPYELRPIPWTKNGFYVRKEDDISHHPYYYAGLYYMQEPSAMVPASRLPVEEGDRILDLCAAPGGKSTELGSRLMGSGILVSNDISNSRAKALLKNLELFGHCNICVCSESPEKLEKLYPQFFNKILIDAPCSGEGMFRKDRAMIKSYAEHGPKYYAPIQQNILNQAYSMLKPGGAILFSTCTFAVLENEDNILSFLLNHPDLHLEPMEGFESFSEGLEKSEAAKLHQLHRCIRLFPHKLQGEGHFAALIRKDGAAVHTISNAKSDNKQKLPTEWEEFSKTCLLANLSGTFKIVGESLYLLSDADAVKKQVRFLRTGLYLGDCKKNRFEPSQALAMYLTKDMVKQSLSLSADDVRVIRYLKGETLELQSSDPDLKNGWILVCVSGYPLGWGKVVNGTLRNKYYAGWRMN